GRFAGPRRGLGDLVRRGPLEVAAARLGGGGRGRFGGGRGFGRRRHGRVRRLGRRGRAELAFGEARVGDGVRGLLEAARDLGLDAWSVGIGAFGRLSGPEPVA